MDVASDDEIELVEREHEDQAVFHLAGAILAERPPHPEAVFGGLKRAWGSFGDEDIRIIPVNDRIYSIIVKLESAAKQILNSGPWNIENRLMNIVPWPRDLAIEEVDFSPIQFWVHIANLPLGMISEGSGWNIGRKIGKVVEVEDPIMFPRSFLRVKVIVDGRKPLNAGFWFPKVGEKRRKIKIGYERLKDFCYRCGRIGHAVRFCKWDDCPEEIDNFYGPDTKVTVARKLIFDEFPANSKKAGGDFWAELGGLKEDAERVRHAHALARTTMGSGGRREEVLDSVTATQLARSMGPRHQTEAEGHMGESELLPRQCHQSEGVGRGNDHSHPDIFADLEPAVDPGPCPAQYCEAHDSYLFAQVNPASVTVESQITNISASPLIQFPPLSFHTPNSDGFIDPLSEVVTKYRSPVELSDCSDSEPMGTPKYIVNEVSDDDDHGSRAIIPVLVKNTSPMQTEVCLSAVFDRLKLKRRSELVDRAENGKRWKGDLSVMCVDRGSQQSVNVGEAVACRTRCGKQKSGRGKSKPVKVRNALVDSRILPLENLTEISIDYVSSWNVFTTENGGGGGPNSTTRQP